MVEEPKDVVAIERTGEFRGRYHVLGGAINPLEGIGPDNLRIRELMTRLGGGDGQGADPRHRPEHRGRGDRDVPGAAGQADGHRGHPAGQRPAGRRRPGVRRRDHAGPGLRGPPRGLAVPTGRPRHRTSTGHLTDQGVRCNRGGHAAVTGAALKLVHEAAHCLLTARRDGGERFLTAAPQSVAADAPVRRRRIVGRAATVHVRATDRLPAPRDTVRPRCVSTRGPVLQPRSGGGRGEDRAAHGRRTRRRRYPIRPTGRGRRLRRRPAEGHRGPLARPDRLARLKRDKVAMAGGVVVILLILMAVFAPLIVKAARPSAQRVPPGPDRLRHAGARRARSAA